jgi:hypothetical protein
MFEDFFKKVVIDPSLPKHMVILQSRNGSVTYRVSSVEEWDFLTPLQKKNNGVWVQDV